MSQLDGQTADKEISVSSLVKPRRHNHTACNFCSLSSLHNNYNNNTEPTYPPWSRSAPGFCPVSPLQLGTAVSHTELSSAICPGIEAEGQHTIPYHLHPHLQNHASVDNKHKIEFQFSHCGQNCHENTWERTNQSSGGCCKTASMTSRRRLLARRCHRQRPHDLVLWTTKTTLKSDYLLKIKAWEKSNRSILVVYCKSWTLGWDSLVPSRV